MPKTKITKISKSLPDTPGVYRFFDASGGLLYIGKAVDLSRRVNSYFTHPHSNRIAQMVELIDDIKIINTDTNIEALILESNLIKQHQPPYNTLQKDDKSFGGIFITSEPYPRVFGARINDQLPAGEWFGPYVSGKNRQIALKVLRKIFRWCNAPDGANLKFKNQNSKLRKPCFYYHIGLCSGACVGRITKIQYRKQIAHLKLFLRGEKHKLLKIIVKDMKTAAKEQKYELAGQLKQELQALEHIEESAFVVVGDSPIVDGTSRLNIECYDVANISDSSIVGAMVVFVGGYAQNSEYRQFKIKTLTKQNDVGAISEMVARRLKHKDWKLPNLMLIDGGIAQVNSVKQIVFKNKLTLPVVGIAKGPNRNKTELVGDIGFVTNHKILLKTLVQARDEAHRFARRYFHLLRKKELLGK